MPRLDDIRGLAWQGASVAPSWPVALPLAAYAMQPQQPRSVYTLPPALLGTVMAHGTAAVQPIFTSWPGFAPGQLTDSQHLVGTVTSTGAMFAVQIDGTTHPDNSANVWTGRLAFRLPGTLPADTLTAVSFTATAGAQDHTPFITPQAMVAAVDARLRAYGGDCGTTVYETSIRDIVTNRPQTNYGVNPLGGWDVVASGPVEVQIRAWSYRRDVASLGYDGWMTDTIYLAAYNDGTYHISARSDQPNWDRPQTGAALGGSVQHKNACIVELRNGTTVLHSWGGPNDVRAFTMPATAFATGDTISNTVLNGFTFAQCVTFAPASGGVLPSGIVANKQYWITNVNYIYYRLVTNSGDCQSAGSLESDSPPIYRAIVQFGTAGSGNIIVTPLVATFGGGGTVFMLPDATPIVIGAAQPPLTIGWDETQQSAGAKLFPTYSREMVRYSSAVTGATSVAYHPNLMSWGPWLNTVGDDPGDNRIGWLNHLSNLAYLMPHDLIHTQTARAQALSWADQPIRFTDPSSGRLIVSDNGPDDIGGTYPNMGRSRPSTSTNATNGGAYTDGHAGSFGNLASDGRGYIDGYSAAPLESSHMPCPWAVPAHQTGSFIFADQGAGHANTAVMQQGNYRSRSINGKQYYNLVTDNQPRGAGWLYRTYYYAEAFTPTAFPESAPVQHAMNSNAKYFSLLGKSFPVGSEIGVIDPTGAPKVQVYQLALWALAVAMDHWRGHRDWTGYIDVIANMQLGSMNERNPYGGSFYFDLGYIISPPDPNSYHTIRGMIATEPFYGPTIAPFPTTGMLDHSYDTNGGWPFGTSAYHAISLSVMAIMADTGVVSTNGDIARDVYADAIRRINTLPCTGIIFSNVAGWSRTGLVPTLFPAFAIVRATP